MAEQAVVSVVRCDAEASDRKVAERIGHAAKLMGGVAEMFADKRKVYIKSNLGITDVRLHAGRQVALADASVVRGTVELIRRYYAGEIILGDASTGMPCREVYEAIGLDRALVGLDVRLVELNEGRFSEWAVPGDPAMFSRYLFSDELQGVDAVVSIAKLKSHLSTGATVCLKNLFGMTPCPIYGTPRRYLHAPIRLPRVLVDVGAIFPPVLNVVDALVAQDGREWGGRPVQTNALIVGNNVVATDATAVRLMGNDPLADYGTPPYLFDINPLPLAHRHGLGPIDAAEISVRGDEVNLGHHFAVDRSWSPELDHARTDVALQMRTYLRERNDLLRGVEGKFAVLANDNVVDVLDSVDALPRRAELAAKIGREDAGILIKQVLPAEAEPERMEIYEEIGDRR
ncbi:MAG TPA: DUF362 domain-containing protein [Chloroflexota bacterium]|nr:DUF362 domain-containing protein [Chloroflexota bacterium]